MKLLKVDVLHEETGNFELQIVNGDNFTAAYNSLELGIVYLWAGESLYKVKQSVEDIFNQLTHNY